VAQELQRGCGPLSSVGTLLLQGRLRARLESEKGLR